MSGWQPIGTAPRDGSDILVAFEAWRSSAPNKHHHVTAARWVWSPRVPVYERHPDEGAFLEIGNDWADDWGGNLMPFAWMPLPEPPTPTGTKWGA